MRINIYIYKYLHWYLSFMAWFFSSYQSPMGSGHSFPRRSNHMKQFWMLRRYLKQNQVNKDGFFPTGNPWWSFNKFHWSHWLEGIKLTPIGIQSYSQIMIGVFNPLLSIVLWFHYHSQQVIWSLGIYSKQTNLEKRKHFACTSPSQFDMAIFH